MVFVPCPNVVQLEAVYVQSGERVENVYHVDNGAPVDAAAIHAIITNFLIWEGGVTKQLRNTATALVHVTGRDLTTANGIVIDQAIIPNINGSEVSAAMPNNVSIAIKWNTGFGGRSFRGRTYHVGLAAGFVTSQTVSQAFVNTATAQYNSLLQQIATGGTAKLVVLSRQHNKAPRATGLATPIISASLTDFNIDSQRRRLPAHNRHH